MKISEHCLSLTKESEGCSLTAYPDPGTGAAPWTIGWGNTHPVDGTPVHKGMTITQEMADSMLESALNKCGERVFAMLSDIAIKKLTQHQFDALVDFAYNAGEKNLQTSTLLKDLNAGNDEAAAAEFPRWNHAGGKVLRGLTIRRQKEQDLFNS